MKINGNGVTGMLDFDRKTDDITVTSVDKCIKGFCELCPYNVLNTTKKDVCRDRLMTDLVLIVSKQRKMIIEWEEKYIPILALYGFLKEEDKDG